MFVIKMYDMFALNNANRVKCKHIARNNNIPRENLTNNKLKAGEISLSSIEHNLNEISTISNIIILVRS